MNTRLTRRTFASSIPLALSPGMVGASRAPIDYFPVGELSDAKVVRDFASRYLAEAFEPVIFNDNRLAFAMRLTIEKSFVGVFVVRVQMGQDGRTAGRFSQLRHVHAGQAVLVVERSVAFSPNDARKLRAMARRLDFWRLDNRNEYICSDGDGWVLEVKDGARYHAVTHSCVIEGPMREIGQAVVDIAGVPL